MIVLDTNVISELMRSQPHPRVVAWIRAQPRAALYTTSINQAEVLFGIEALPLGRRRTALARGAEAMFAEDFHGRVLSFDPASAARYASLVATRRKSGRAIESFDALIAATALAVGAAVLATRDGGFEDCGLTIVNPWEAP